MREMLDEKLGRFEFLESQMADPEVQADSRQMAEIAREHGSLAKLATKYRRFKEICNEIDEVREMSQSNDPEERELADSEFRTPVLDPLGDLGGELIRRVAEKQQVGRLDHRASPCPVHANTGTVGNFCQSF